MDLARLLHERAARAEADDDAVAQATSVDASLLAQLHAQAQLQQLAEQRHAVETGAQAAVVAQLVRDLAEGVVGEEAGEDADAEVAEASEQTVKPVVHRHTTPHCTTDPASQFVISLDMFSF